jgi:hypothetical protein
MLEENEKYHQEAKIPIRIIGEKRMIKENIPQRELRRGLLRQISKIIYCLVLIFSIIASQSLFVTAFEAYVINVTAKICEYSEIRSMGYWKNHPEVYASYLPQNLGDEMIDNVSEANQVFLDYNLSMRNKLRGQLLAMKFNIAHFGIGEYFVESEGKNLNQIVAEADDLLRQDPPPPDSVLEEMKNLLDYLNNLEKIRYCRVPGAGGPEPHIVINEVYYDVNTREACGPFEEDPKNEWVEIYNPTDEEIDISGWTIEDNTSQDIIPPSPPIPAGGFAIISQDSSTWQFWSIPEEAIKIELGSRIGNGLANDGDRVILRDQEGNIVDQMSYEGDISIWNPAPPLDELGNPYDLPDGHSLGRDPDGFDLDEADDFKDFEYPTPGGKSLIPRVQVIIPNGGEIWYMGQTYSIEWSATNPGGDDSLLNIDIWYSKNSGQTWFYLVAENLPNAGVYDWTIPIDPNLATTQGRIKVLATNPEGLSGWDMSDCDFCPPLPGEITVTEEGTVTEEELGDEETGIQEEIQEGAATENPAEEMTVETAENDTSQENSSTQEEQPVAWEAPANDSSDEVETPGDNSGDGESAINENQSFEEQEADETSVIEELINEEPSVEPDENLSESETQQPTPEEPATDNNGEIAPATTPDEIQAQLSSDNSQNLPGADTGGNNALEGNSVSSQVDIIPSPNPE